MKKLALKIGVQEKVIFHDPVSYDKIPRFIKLVDLGIIPLPDLQQWRNQCPLKLLEYLAMGKVVIATDIPANRDVLGDSKCGILVPSAEPREIANAIVYAYNNRGILGELGIQGQAIIEKRYSWTRVANDFEEYLHQL
jgi:glycosyltransferase involved in cell wall biosynthesis